MSKIKKLAIVANLIFLLNSADKPLIAQTSELKLDTADAETIKYKKFYYARELLDLEKQAGFNVQPSHYQVLDSLVNEIGGYIGLGGIAEDYKKTQAINNLENIDLILKDNFLYKKDLGFLFHEVLETKKINSFYNLIFYLEVAANKKLPLVPVKADEHFFLRWYLNDSNFFNWETLSGMEIEDKFYKKSIEKTDEIKEINKELFLGHLYKIIGIALNEKKQYNKAIDFFDKSMMANMVDPETHKYQGDSWFAVGNYVKAIDDYDMAINLDQSFAQAYFSRGNVFYKKNKLEKALKDYNQAIKLNPENSEFYKNRGDVYSLIYKKGNVWDKERKPKKAQEDYNKALELILKK